MAKKRDSAASSCVPHANRPGIICTLVRIIHFYGASSRRELERALGLSSRHLDYYLDASRSLAFLATPPGLSLTALGAELARTCPGSKREGEVFRRAVRANALLERWVLGDVADDDLVGEFVARGLAKSSAARRVSTVRAWSSFLGDMACDAGPAEKVPEQMEHG